MPTPAPEASEPRPETVPGERDVAPQVTQEIPTPAAPESSTRAPEMPTPAPESSTRAPEMPTPAPEASTRAPEMPTQTPEASTRAPERPEPTI